MCCLTSFSLNVVFRSRLFLHWIMSNSVVRATDVDAHDYLRDLYRLWTWVTTRWRWSLDKTTLMLFNRWSYYVQKAAQSRLLSERRSDGLSTGRFAPAMSTTTKVYRLSLRRTTESVYMRPTIMIWARSGQSLLMIKLLIFGIDPWKLLMVITSCIPFNKFPDLPNNRMLAEKR